MEWLFLPQPFAKTWRGKPKREEAPTEASHPLLGQAVPPCRGACGTTP